MIVKFHARGAGRGSGPVEYLLGKDMDREGATLDRGNPHEIQELIDSSPYAKKYTSGVLSFEESDLDRSSKDRLMSSFEKALLPGLDVDQYSCLWVEHRDKGRLELNFVVPNVELQTGKRLQPYFDKADKPRINAWKTGMNASMKLHDPDDPMNKRALITPRDLPSSKQEAAQSITDGLLSIGAKGELKSRQDVVEALESVGFTVARQTSKSISIADPDGGRNLRLKGMIYEQDFKFGTGLRGEIEAASERYRAASQARIREARDVYSRGFEIKRAENQKRHKRPESTYERVSTQELALVGLERVCRSGGVYERDNVAGKPDPRELADDQPAKRHDERSQDQRREYSNEYVREEEAALCGDRPQCRWVYNGGGQTFSMEDPEGILNDDRARKTAIERLRSVTERARRATSRLCDGLQWIKKNVRDYLDGKPDIKIECLRLDQSSERLERAAPTVGKALQQEITAKRHEMGGRGMSL